MLAKRKEKYLIRGNTSVYIGYVRDTCKLYSYIWEIITIFCGLKERMDPLLVEGVTSVNFLPKVGQLFLEKRGYLINLSNFSKEMFLRGPS